MDTVFAAFRGFLTSLVLTAGLALAPEAWAQVNIVPKADVTVTTTATLVLGGNAFRARLSCTNHGSVNVRWGSSAVTATVGQRIPSGASIEIFNRGAVYMIAESASATVSCTEETN